MTHCRVPPEPSVRARARNERFLFHSIGRCVRVRERESGRTQPTLGWGANSQNQGFGDQSSVKFQILNLVRSIRTVTRKQENVASACPQGWSPALVATQSKMHFCEDNFDLMMDIFNGPNLWHDVLSKEWFHSSSKLIGKFVSSSNSVPSDSAGTSEEGDALTAPATTARRLEKYMYITGLN
ncbi:Immediate early response 3-interacting protein 1 [Eumeta japonica]|uniref:Immediate early response 3-interacting protein 1 n=1 Tax=Eumeta variegata TaxID=151549 RepID=A0A4C2A5C1_EUMVA|nr:Immediate early response 3-interacting protein 1 [Eumeta japonica]